MSDYKVVAETGQTLVQVIWTAINADADLKALIGDPSLISLESPAEHVQNKDAALLSIYLYQIKEDPYLKNRNPVEGPGGLLQRVPMALDLYYLITPMLTAARDRQIVLGKVMQLLYDRPTLEGADLVGTLAGSGEILRAVLDPVPINEIALIWQALDIPYMLCVSYLVRVALMNSTDETSTTRVIGIDRRYGARVPALTGGG
ncbi:MAG: DUF4255 domain-containing protein [Aliidongia sp.]